MYGVSATATITTPDGRRAYLLARHVVESRQAADLVSAVLETRLRDRGALLVRSRIWQIPDDCLVP